MKKISKEKNKTPNALERFQLCLVLLAAVFFLQNEKTFAQATTDSSKTKPAQISEERDGQRDFDFQFGTWKTHIKRLRKPLTNSTDWVEYDGVSIVRKVWDGRASLLELDVKGAAGRIQGLGLRLYNAESRQWSLNWANGSDSILTAPMIGEFKNGRGDFYNQDSFNGRVILVHNSFSEITANSNRFEQAFSDDGGKAWETNWIMTFTRTKDETK